MQIKNKKKLEILFAKDPILYYLCSAGENYTYVSIVYNKKKGNKSHD